ncbi:MAG: permease [Clostridiales bacterium]|nr:permease [Clostridiales bacterium]
MNIWRKIITFVLIFIGIYKLPLGNARIQSALLESVYMLQDYAQNHVILCLIPAFFIAGAISNFISQGEVLKYFGSDAKKWISYTVASISGTVLAVCSCTVLPLFTGIYKKGAGIGPAVAFLYSGPAINILAIILTARVIGWQMGVARAVGAIVFSVVIGLIMAKIYKNEDKERKNQSSTTHFKIKEDRSGKQNLLFFLSLISFLIFANWGKPAEAKGFFIAIYQIKWIIAGVSFIAAFYATFRWFDKDERIQWFEATWDFAQQILPLLFFGVLIAGFMMGRPGLDQGLIPSEFISFLVGGNSIFSNLFASIAGAFMYFATLTEIPIVEGLIGLGMGKGPALALLLAGPALSLPNMLVIKSVLGLQKTFVFVGLVVFFATVSGMVYGYFV